MTELMEMALEIKKMDEENKIMSVLRGNRNWGIRIEIMPESGNKYAYIGRYGTLERRGLLSELISEIVKYHIRWFTYTYKKDFEEAITMLENNNYKIRWIQ
jgi:hypothetical protein